jgi:hypothetical protein
LPRLETGSILSFRTVCALSPTSGLLFNSGDRTHHNNYGLYELARCVVEGIKQNKLDLTKFLADDFAAFDLSDPDPFDRFDVPASPLMIKDKPEGN